MHNTKTTHCHYAYNTQENEGRMKIYEKEKSQVYLICFYSNSSFKAELAMMNYS